MNIEKNSINPAERQRAFFSSLATIVFLCMVVLSNTMKSLGFPANLRVIVTVCILYLPLALAFFSDISKFPYDYLLLFAVVWMFYHFTLIIHPEYKNFISEEMSQSIIASHTGIVGYLYVRQFSDVSLLKKVLIVSSVILFISYSLQGINALRLGYWENEVNGMVIRQTYSMSYGYNMLRPCLVFLFYGMQDKNKLMFSAGVIGSVSILMLGSRAAAICVLAFLALYFYFYTMRNSDKKKRTSLIIGIFIFALIWCVFYRPILESVASLFESLGFPSRTIERLLEGSLADDTIREEVYYARSFRIIKNGGFLGLGMLADRYYLGNYCHNIFLEIFINFGWIGGTVLTFLLVVLIYRMLFKCKSDSWRGIFLIFFCSCFFRLLVSYSFWDDTNFWMMLATAVNYKALYKGEKQ